jgi:hypothetical protein
MQILFGDFNAKVHRADVSKVTVGNESLHKTGNDNQIRVVNFAPSENLIGKTINWVGHILINKQRNSSILDVQSFRTADCDTDHYLFVANISED